MTSTTPNSSAPVEEQSLAWKIFTAFVSDDQISLTEDELRLYAINDLKVVPEKIPSGMMDSLPVILVAFMNMWSGWHFKAEFQAGKIEKKHYFERFQKFMAHKINIIVPKQFPTALKEVESIKLDIRAEVEFLPYAINIGCPADMLNTIVFSDVGDDVVMKQHLGARWVDLSAAQLIHWPHVEVTFQTQDIRFVRAQAVDFERYLNSLPHESNRHSKYMVEYVQPCGKQECYSFNYLEKYIDTYLVAFKKCPQVTGPKYIEVNRILTHFLEDVKYMDINKSIATNTNIRFKLAPVPFIRNKKLVKNSEKEDEVRVGYCEIIIPKIELRLDYFKPVQKAASYLSFEYTEKLKDASQHKDICVMPQITYKCTFCNLEFKDETARELMVDHLKYRHQMEQHVRCTLCKKQFEVLSLAACRWRHKCRCTLMDLWK